MAVDNEMKEEKGNKQRKTCPGDFGPGIVLLQTYDSASGEKLLVSKIEQ